MSCQIRTAVPSDEERIKSLFLEMLQTIYQTQDVNGYEPGDLDRFWDSENRIYVAEDGEVIAFLSVEMHHEEKDYLYLDDFSVTAACRNNGIGTKLLQAAESYADETGIPAILLHVEKTNEAAFRFYQRHGYTVFRDDGNRYLMIKTIITE